VATQYWVENGLVAGKAVIKVAAAMGEGPMLRDDEWPALLRTVVQNAGGKAAVVCGIHYKDTVRTIEDARRAQDRAPSLADQSAHLQRSDARRHPALLRGGLERHRHRHHGVQHLVALRRQRPAETILKMADFEHVVSIKWSVPEGQDYEDMRKFAHIFNVIDNSSSAPRCHKLGGRGYINLTADVHPATT